jgi:magnesium transporter
MLGIIHRSEKLTTPAHPSGETSLKETAGSYMVTHIPRATVNTTVDTVIQSLRGKAFECADTVFVTGSTGRLEGIVRINDLFANGERQIGEIMEPEHEAVQRDDDQEQIAVLAMQLNMIAVPVVDEDAKLIGAVPPEALFKILRAEHMEDLQRFAGIMPHEEGPQVALDAPLYDRLRRRLPWLIFGLFASTVITFLMAGFEQTLSANVAVAFFVPALVYIAGAIGTQAVSVAVRGLSTDNISIGGLLRDELIIGVTIGITLGAIAFVSVFITFDDLALALAVGLAVLGGGAISAVVGFGLPWIFLRLGTDPALGSGPICTIIQDVASLSIYFVLVIILIT